MEIDRRADAIATLCDEISGTMIYNGGLSLRLPLDMRAILHERERESPFPLSGTPRVSAGPISLIRSFPISLSLSLSLSLCAANRRVERRIASVASTRSKARATY